MSGSAPRIDQISSGAGLTYVGNIPAIGGSSPYQLTSSDLRNQILNPPGNINIQLPSTNILAGETWKIVNQSSNQINIMTSAGTYIDSIVAAGYAQFTALTSTPTTQAAWLNVSSNNTLFSSFLQANRNWVTPRFVNGPSTGAYQYVGGVLAPNGKVIFVPYTSSAPIGIYDPVANSFTAGPSTGAYQYLGGVLAPNGKVIFVPISASAPIGIYDTMLSVPLQVAMGPWFNKL